MKWLAIGLLFSCLTHACYSENETFVPTKEWQEIKSGQGIPPGLHIRINLETGKKEAKLLDDDNKKPTTGLSVVPENSSEAPPSTDFKEKKTLSDVLKKLPKNSQGGDYSPEEYELPKTNYLRYSDLADVDRSLKGKDIFDDPIQSSAELISKQIQEYKTIIREKNKHTDLIRILYNFYFTINLYDNADRFITDGGLEDVLLPTIVNSTHSNLREVAMIVLATLTKSGREAQVSVYEKNFGSHLSQIIITSKCNKELSTSLYALESLLKGFPLAQNNILSRSGIRALITVLNKDCDMKTTSMAMTLISNLIVEKNHALANAAQQDYSEYIKLNFEEWLTTHEFCQTVDATLSLKMYELIEQPDVTRNVVRALEVTAPICHEVWSKSPQLRHTLLTVRNRFLHSNKENPLDVAKLIEKVNGFLFKSTDKIKDEL